MDLEEFVDPKFLLKVWNPEDFECQRNVTFWKAPTGWDTAVCIITLILAFLSFVLLVLAIIFRNYPPIRFRHIPLSVLSFIGGLLWSLGTLAVNDNYFYSDVNLGFCLVRRCKILFYFIILLFVFSFIYFLVSNVFFFFLGFDFFFFSFFSLFALISLFLNYFTFLFTFLLKKFSYWTSTWIRNMGLNFFFFFFSFLFLTPLFFFSSSFPKKKKTKEK